MKSSSGLLAAVLLLVPVPALAQTTTQSTTTPTTSTPTLSDLARKAQEKKGTPPATKTFTNDDLKSVNAPPASEDSSKPGDAKDAKAGDVKSSDAKSGAGAKADEPKKDDPSKADPTKTEKYWHERMDAAREDVRRNQSFATALQSRINGLTADFSARDDPYQRAQIADERQKALAELDRVNKAIEDGTKAIAAIEEEARRAMVPAGWIR
jgi:hypothetical protein